MSGDLVLTEQDGGREVPVSAGQVIELRLAENPTTGFRWTFDAPGIEVIEDRYEDTGEGLGAGSTRVLRLRVPAADTDLHLRRGQKWDPAMPPDATLELHLKLR